MKNLKLLFYKEIKESFSLKGSYILSLAFFSISIILLPIGVGPNKGFISSIAPGLVWVSIILTSLLSLNNIFYEDFNDGTLDLFKISPLSIVEICFIKAFVHWISNFLPLIIITPILSIFLDFPPNLLVYLIFSLILGTPSLSFIGILGSSLTLSLKQHNLLIPLIIFPLFIPILIFGSGAISSLMYIGFEDLYIRQVLILTGLSGLSIALCPFACSYILNVNYD